LRAVMIRDAPPCRDQPLLNARLGFFRFRGGLDAEVA
jgi:hypothetical protein